MANTIKIDPLTRVEGHHAWEVKVEDNGNVSDVWASGTMFRGMEGIMSGRDLRDAPVLLQRI
jgi:Ni,Fe-hydrogenase I large subunit